MGEVRMRFVCDDEGRHKETALTTIHAVETTDGFELAWTRNSKGVRGIDPPPPKHGDPTTQHMADYETHLMLDRDTDPERTFRTSVPCPRCQRHIVFNERTVTSIVERYRDVGGLFSVNISTGAIIHKQ